MCGAISGFHSLIASGTTPKMLNKESDIRSIGYGAMVVEGFVAVTALVAACALQPGDYFAINVAAAKQPAMIAAAQTQHQWNLAPVELPALEEGTREHLVGRTGGAVTLAVGMAKVFASVPGLKQLMSYWYHFVIMFEALFILTLLETGTRVARFVFQESVTVIGGKAHWGMNVGMTLLTCFAWGYLLFTGNINTLWRMLGIANQLLATIALAVGTTYLLNHAPKRVYALCTGIPFVFVIVTVLTAGWMSVSGWLNELQTAPADKIFSLKLMSALATIMLVLTVVIAVDAMRKWWRILRGPGAPVLAIETA
jgi:carbon starvation protein